MPESVAGALASYAQQIFKLGEDDLDQLRPGAVGREEEQCCAARLEQSGSFDTLIAAKIVEDDDVIGPELGDDILAHLLGEDRLIGLSTTKGATIPSLVRPARKVVIFQ